MLLAIVDGTGPFRDKTYAGEMNHSFCRQMYTNAEGTIGHYERGPSNDGMTTRAKGIRAADFIKQNMRLNPDGKVFLAGYSRGGSAVLYTAKALKADKIDVDGMFLFDPVARHVIPGGEVIPANVKAVWVARRSTSPALVVKYEGTIGLNLPGGIGIMNNPMRVWFGGTAHQYEGPGTYKEQTFAGSHGALGGVGWTHVIEDAPCQVAVAAWMNSAFKTCGLQITLSSYPPSSKP